MKNTPADFEHAAELLAENTRLRAALAERARQHEAALADIEKAQTDIGRLRIWHERALDERDATRARLSALGKPASEPIDAEEVRLMREVCRIVDGPWYAPTSGPSDLALARDALRRHRERTRAESGGEG